MKRRAARGRRGRLFLIVATVIVLIGIVFVVEPAFVLDLVAVVVVEVDELQRSDLVYVLNGRVEARSEEPPGSSWWASHQGYSSRIRGGALPVGAVLRRPPWPTGSA